MYIYTITTALKMHGEEWIVQALFLFLIVLFVSLHIFPKVGSTIFVSVRSENQTAKSLGGEYKILEGEIKYSFLHIKPN